MKRGVVTAVVFGASIFGLVGCAAGPEEEPAATASTSAFVENPDCNPWIDPECRTPTLPPPCVGFQCNPTPHQCPAMACFGTVTDDCRCVPHQPPMCFTGCEMGQHQLPDCSCVGEPWNPWSP